MQPREMYIGRRRRRSGPGCFLGVAGAAVLLLVGGIGLGLYSLISTAGPPRMPALAFLATATPTPVPPTPTPIPMLTGRVLDAYSNGPLAGASIAVGEQEGRTAADGTFRLRLPTAAAELRVSAPSYETVTRPVGPGSQAALQIGLRPTKLEGLVRNAGGQPIAGARVAAGSASAVTGPDGRYTLVDVPAEATVTIEAPDHTSFKEPLNRRASIDATLRANSISGLIKTKEGQPVPRATIAIGDANTTTGADGRFRLADIPDSGTLIIKAAGYAIERRPLQAGSSLEVALTPQTIKAIYMTHNTVADEKRFNDLLALIKRTEINGVVIDIKGESGLLFYESQVPLAREVDALEVTYDVKKRLKQLKDANIYVIARQVVMEDSLMAKARPDWAVRNRANGQNWRDRNGIGWLNAYRDEVWDYNIEIAKEAAELGFDEIQFDYIRFPTDGNLNVADFGRETSEEANQAAIAAGLARVYKALLPIGVFLAADVFGLITVNDKLGVGQNVGLIADSLDYICPMVYPSHYFPGEFGFAKPATKPYEVVKLSLEAGNPKLEGRRARYRPWLQDFDLYGTPYTPEMVRAQIRASEENNTSGWLLWNAANKYQEAALRPAN